MTGGIVDPAFGEVPKKSTAFIIWRVVNLQLELVKKEEHGSFYSGDSYLIYSAFEPGQPCGTELKPKEVNGRMDRFIHFWLGSQTSQDEAGIAAIKSVELDDYLGGSPVQQREVEGAESSRFMTYFYNGIKLLPGGAASGFKHVTSEKSPVLYAVKGKRIPVIRHLPAVSWSHMNSGDVFVLDNKTNIFVWTGASSNRHEKMFGAKLAQTLKSEHGGSNVVIVEDDQELALPLEEREIFDSMLPIAQKKLQSIEEAGSDEAQEASVVVEIKLYHCSDESGTLKVTEVKSGPLLQTDLKSEDTFIVDNGPNGVFVWIGKKASQQERTEAMRNGQGFAKKKGYPPTTNVLRVIDGGEPSEFKSLFRAWKDRDQTTGMGSAHSVGKIAQVKKTTFDAATLHEQPKLAAESGMVDDGSGKKEIFRVENMELVPVPESLHGKFFAGDCFVINYSYLVGSAEHNILYYWLGSTSGQDEKGAAALRAVEMDMKMGGRAVQVRVVQGKEPRHFVAMFGGKLIIFAGGKASAFEKQEGETDAGVADTYLLHVRGYESHNTRAIEVPLRAASLNSNDVFILVSPKVVYLWCGKGATGDEREMAKKIISEHKLDATVVAEGCEKPDFWQLLGGKTEYYSDPRTAEEYHVHAPRLFHCSNATGNLKVEEILEFDQTDLIEDDIMILDAGHAVFIWLGADSNKDELALAEELVINYLKSDPSERNEDTSIIKIRQGCEPPNFIGFFGVWDPNSWTNRSSFEKIKAELMSEDPEMTVATSSTKNGKKYFPMELLLEKDADKLPRGVNPSHKEDFLIDQDFVRAFNMSRDAYTALPTWKQQNLKRAVGLF